MIQMKNLTKNKLKPYIKVLALFKILEYAH